VPKAKTHPIRTTAIPITSTIVLTMASHGHGPHYSAKPGPVPFPRLTFAQRAVPKVLGATMWFWVMYRLREELPVLTGQKHPWDH